MASVTDYFRLFDSHPSCVLFAATRRLTTFSDRPPTAMPSAYRFQRPEIASLCANRIHLEQFGFLIRLTWDLFFNGPLFRDGPLCSATAAVSVFLFRLTPEYGARGRIGALPALTSHLPILSPSPPLDFASNTFFSSSNNFGFSAHVFVFALDSNELLSMLRFLFGSYLVLPRVYFGCCSVEKCHLLPPQLSPTPLSPPPSRAARMAEIPFGFVAFTHRHASAPRPPNRMEVSGDFDDFRGNSDAVQRTRDYDDSYLCCL